MSAMNFENAFGPAGPDLPIPELSLRYYLAEWSGMPPEQFLPLASSLAASVAELHQQHIIHLDLRPERIHVFPAHNQSSVPDAGLAVQRTDKRYVRPDGQLANDLTLPYCSPENTGRMLRTVDERSDLYSLGVIFYEMLTGRLPFEADNPLEWVYLHLVKSVPPMTNSHMEWPEGLEAIIMKLLEKNPDKRYSSALLLQADLNNIGHSPPSFILEPGFHGREYELSVLTQALYSVCFGSTELVYISGEAGIGKTSLMDKMFRNQPQAGEFFYITGKFEQLANESPYYPIIQAFRGLIRHLLGEHKDKAELWSMRLREALGTSIGIITAIIPEAAVLLGEAPAVEVLPPYESHKRFIYAFRKFVQALASKEHPIVLFIDDLQWANSSSLQLIHALVCDPECQYLLFVCAYRHRETDARTLPGYEPDGSVSKQAVVRHLHLEPLDMAHMNRFVMETLNSPASTTMDLTELLYHKSGGNPFHFKQILLRMQDDGTLRYSADKHGWQWDWEQMLEREPGFSIQELMAYRMSRLAPEAQQLLQTAACVGSSFSPQFIAQAANQNSVALAAQWSAIEGEGIILPVHKGLYRFAHDSIQKLIYGQLENSAKQALHLHIGRFLNRQHQAEAAAGDAISMEDGKHAFEAVNHMNRGAVLIADKEERLELAQLNLEAGSRAKASSAFDVAVQYFHKGALLLGMEGWNSSFELCFNLYAQKAECEYMCGNHAQSDSDLELLLSYARGPAERSRVFMIRIMQFINQGKYSEGTALGLQSLRELQIIIDPNPGSFMLMLEGIRIEQLLRNRYDKLLQLKEMTDPDYIAAMNLIFAVVPSTFFTDKKIYFQLICRAIQLSLKHGNTPVSAAVYSAYGMILGNTRGQFDKGYAIGKIGVELSEIYNSPSIKSTTYTIYGGVLCQFAGKAGEGEAYVSQAMRYGMDSGDYVFASYAIGAHINALYARAPLSDVNRKIAEYMVVLDTTKDEFVRQNFFLYQQFFLALQGRTAAPDSFSGADFDEEHFLKQIRQEETAATTLFQFCTYKTQLCFLLGRYEDAIGWAHQAKTHEAYATHLPHLPECLFYESLAIIAVYPELRRHRIIRKNLLRNLGRYRKWAAWSPDFYQARSDILHAEYARACNEQSLAEELYDKALRQARELGDKQAISLAAELAASFYTARSMNKIALFYLQTALEGYRQWEVYVKSEQLEEQLLGLQRQEQQLAGSASPRISFFTTAVEADGSKKEQPAASISFRSSETLSTESLDLAAILQTTEAIANPLDMDAVLAEIMKTILKHAGASKGALLTGSNDALYVQVYAALENPNAPCPFELNDSSLLPEGIIRYVLRTQEKVHYAGTEESWLIHNPYMAKHQPQSVICIPVSVHGTMLGVLYLENKLASGVFTADRTPVLLAMASYGLLMCVLQSLPEQPESQSSKESAVQPLPDMIAEPLTERELEVLALLASGLSNKEIAEHLIIALSTVKVHVKNIFAKLKVNRRTKAVAQAKEMKLLS
ncbi:PAS sensor protein [Paenibacillus sp. BIHB 4019]|uniref:PAS sensor protein n=1 Tax=Paenibacillus sp. BIHB 4019 TaxID=1870819 RepID=A0A1B2DJC6_9BACL|nr:AAA family ATPase [Paenibacillus sp. BIHB 4019]ANY67775.1 PAS sensor protein [Paenibacillus sp. BIHB 4019]